MSYRKAQETPSFTLAELFVEILNPRLGPYFIHFQVYGLNSIFQQTIRAMVPPFLCGRFFWIGSKNVSTFFRVFCIRNFLVDLNLLLNRSRRIKIW